MKRWTVIRIAAVLVIFVGLGMRLAYANQELNKSDYTRLIAGGNIYRINVKGEVESKKVTNVYTTVNLPIKAIYKDLGEPVAKGEILAELDTDVLKDQIAELESSIHGKDALNACTLETAKCAYENALRFNDNERNKDILTAKSAFDAAQRDYIKKKDLLEKFKTLFEKGGISKQEMDDYEIAYKNAKNTYEEYAVALETVKAKIAADLEIAKYEYEAAKVAYEDDSQHIALKNLKDDLENAVIKSPIDGVVSKKNAEVGNMSSGSMLFEITDDSELIVTVNIKEVDILKVSAGQQVEIKTDATGAEVIPGEVTAVRVIATDDNDNLLDLTDDSNDEESEYEAEVSVMESEDKLKIGMHVKADVITDKKEGFFIVPGESVIKNKDDDTCLYIADLVNGKYIVKEIPVTKGAESDLEVEVFGKALAENMIVINTPMDFKVGDTLKIDAK